MGSNELGKDGTSLQKEGEEEILAPRKAHECPVPKPKGLLGEVLGFKNEDSKEKLPRPRIETIARTKSRKAEP